jgi:uncharacterized protein YggE
MRALTLALTCCLALAGCGHAPPDRRGVGRDEVLVQIAASGHSDTRPDEARFTAGVETIDATAAAASVRNNELINRVVASLRGLGVRQEDVQTQRITLSRIDSGRDHGRFQANNEISVRVRDINRAGEAIAATTQAGANVLSGPDLRVDDPEAASRSAYAQAFRAARARAEAYAQAANLRVARVLAIRDFQNGYSSEVMTAASGMSEDRIAAEPPPVMAGTNASDVRIRVDFALGPQ